MYIYIYTHAIHMYMMYISITYVYIRFLVCVQLLAMYRGKLSAVIARLISKYL